MSFKYFKTDLRFSEKLAAFVRLFLQCILGISAVLKIVGLVGQKKIIYVSDPIFALPNWCVYSGVAAVELSLVYFILRSRDDRRNGILTLALAASFGTYRLARRSIGVREPCPCFGRVTDWIPGIAPHEEALGLGMLIIIAAIGLFLFVFSCSHHQPKTNAQIA
jgi:hypothetical protein